MKRAAAILAGGESSRLPNKPLVLLARKPMILYTIDRCKKMADELLVVANSEEQSDAIRTAIGEVKNLRIVIDRKEGFFSPLLGARTAFENSKSELTLLLPCDAPLVRESVLELLFTVIDDRDAVIPRHPNGQIEPLHAVYRTRVSLKAVSDALSSGKRSMRDLIMKLSIVYMSTKVVRQLDPDLDSFANVNTQDELKSVEQKLTRSVL
ncbi:MAG: molybdenum cofactor guanylyltransferase [Promethearchaeati archaeon SRVP18_Atabeyarchaeia-1]